ncbi:anti-sigma factor family protein [Planctomyces sp. SH-PL62]|uniref:anti-sigma factor family protein n=1 Tax=Planctomyces sp. SH-PL62 TaxID=1636152 RepID=UPI00078C0D41|nr:hypothetical protein [Planctomyces sp. SH-PL62]AMV38937.1 hypothetical protein VT85_15990 [Planctomyces sp. SH-PL62]
MSDELESLLSAYLDDELDPDEKRAAAASLASNPEKAKEFRSLVRVHELINGLSRPPGRDLAPEVLQRLAASSPPTWRSGPSARLRRFSPAYRAGLAAAVVLISFLGMRTAIQPPAPQAPRHPGAAAPSLHTAEDSSRPSASDPVGPPAILAATTPNGPEADLPGPPVLTAPAVDRPRLIATDLLARSGPHRIFLVSGGDGRPARAEVASMLGLSSHRDFYRFELPREGAADLSSADSVVYAAELDRDELTTLRNRLASAFPGRLDEGEASTSLMTELADLGRTTTLRAEPAAEVHFPQTKMALRTPTDPQSTGSGTVAPGSDPIRPEDGVAASDPVGPPALPRIRTEAPSSVILIWILDPSGE